MVLSRVVINDGLYGHSFRSKLSIERTAIHPRSNDAEQVKHASPPLATFSLSDPAGVVESAGVNVHSGWASLEIGTTHQPAEIDIGAELLSLRVRVE